MSLIWPLPACPIETRVCASHLRRESSEGPDEVNQSSRMRIMFRGILKCPRKRAVQLSSPVGERSWRLSRIDKLPAWHVGPQSCAASSFIFLLPLLSSLEPPVDCTHRHRWLHQLRLRGLFMHSMLSVSISRLVVPFRYGLPIFPRLWLALKSRHLEHSSVNDVVIVGE